MLKVKSRFQVVIFIGLLSLTAAKTFGIDEDTLKTLEQSEVSEVFALYDHEAKLVLYKDATVPACYIQRLVDAERDVGSLEIVLTGKPLNESKGASAIASRFQKEFCSNLPVYEMDMDTAADEPHRRVHRSRRGKRDAYNGNQGAQDNLRRGPSEGTQQHQYHWPGSQTQVQGNVAGNGHFSGQAQSAYNGLSQSQIQLGGVGLTGSIASVAGGAQSALRLGSRSGSGQISSSGYGQSASDLQLNLGEPGQESSGRAMVMQHHHQSGQAGSQLQGSSDFGSKQHQNSGILQQGSYSASGYGQGQGGSSYRKYSSGDTASDIQAPLRDRPGQNIKGSNGFQTLSPGHSRSESGISNYGGSGSQQGQGFVQGRAQGSGVQGRVTSIDKVAVGRDIHGQTTSQVNGGRTYQQHAIHQPPQNFGGNGFQGQFRSDSVNIRDSPAMMPAPAESQYGSGHGQQSVQIQQSDQRYYAQQQPRTDASQHISNGFRMRTETFGAPRDSQQYALPSRQAGGGRVESAQEETLTTHTQQHHQPQYPAQQDRLPATQRYATRVQETQTDVFPPAPAHQQQPLPQNGHATRTETTETQTSLQQQSNQAQFGSRQDVSQPIRGHQQTYESSLTGGQRTYAQQGDLPMMTSYPVTNGRRVYQRRIVTYYPGQMSSVSLQPHYIQQTMAGRESQGFSQPQHHGQTTGSAGETGRCHTVTFQCTVIFDTNGKSKLCQPKPVANGGNGHSNICCC